MLNGSIIFSSLDEDKNIFREKYIVTGVDTSSSMYLRLSTNSYRGIDIMAGDESSDDGNDLDSRRLDISMNSVKVQTKYYTDSSGKVTQKLGVNNDFFSSIGALIRYAKINCITSNEVNYTGLVNASGGFSPEKQSTYNIFDAEDNFIGTVTLEYGEIKELHLENMWFKIDLVDDPTSPMDIFGAIKNAKIIGFRFNEEFLGFPAFEKGTENIDFSGDEYYATIEEIIKAHPEKEYSWLLSRNYVIVTDDMLDDLITEFENTDDFVFCDTETTGLDITFKSRVGQGDQCVGVILSKDEGTSYFFPTQMKCIKNLCDGDHFYFMSRIKRILESKKLVGHNAPFDWKVFYIYDINANFVEDTMAMIALTLGNEKQQYPLSLKKNTKLLLGRDALELSDISKTGKWGDGEENFADLSENIVRLYGCADGDNTQDLFYYFRDNDILQKYNAEKIYRIETIFGLAVAYQEFYGHHIDVDNIEKLNEEIAIELKELMTTMEDMVGHTFNPNSSPQLRAIMYTELGIPAQYNRKTGKVTTDKDTLKYLASLEVSGEPMYPFVKILQRYREVEGVRKIFSQIDKMVTPDGYLFSSVQQYGTTTGRVSIKQPNYQSYNDTVKKYICPRTGYYMADTDYSSIEYRVTGNMSGNKMIKEGFYDPDFDYHTYQAARMYSVPYAAVTKKLRQAAKGLNFGIPYGMGNESLGVRIFGEATAENTAKAAFLHKKYFEGGQEDIEVFFEDARDKAVAKGYTETYFGRRRYYYRNKFSINSIRRQAGNAVIQGSAADIYKLAVGRVFLRICKEGWLGKVLFIGFIHDELLLEVHNSINPYVFLRVLREEFEVKIDGWCPLYMGFGFGMNWYQAKKTELPIRLQWELVEKYGNGEYTEWNGDGKKFADGMNNIIRDYAIRHVATGIQDVEQQGKEIKPALNTDLIDVLQEDDSSYKNAIVWVLKKKCEDFLNVSTYLSTMLSTDDATVYSIISEADENYLPVICDVLSKLSEGFQSMLASVKTNDLRGTLKNMLTQSDIPVTNIKSKGLNIQILFSFTKFFDIQSVLLDNIEMLKSKLAESHVSNVQYTEQGTLVIDYLNELGVTYTDKIMDTQSALDIFCKTRGIDRSTVNILSIDTNVKTESNLEEKVKDTIVATDSEEEDNSLVMLQRIQMLGLYLDIDNKMVVIRMEKPNVMEFIYSKTNSEGKGYKVRISDKDKMYDTEVYLESEYVSLIQNLYLQLA